jgi:hypothetical protein
MLFGSIHVDSLFVPSIPVTAVLRELINYHAYVLAEVLGDN